VLFLLNFYLVKIHKLSVIRSKSGDQHVGLE
jgi:hypothetical protein